MNCELPNDVNPEYGFKEAREEMFEEFRQLRETLVERHGAEHPLVGKIDALRDVYTSFTEEELNLLDEAASGIFPF